MSLICRGIGLTVCLQKVLLGETMGLDLRRYYINKLDARQFYLLCYQMLKTLGLFQEPILYFKSTVMKEKRVFIAIILLGLSLTTGIFGLTLWFANNMSLPRVRLGDRAQTMPAITTHGLNQEF